MTKPEFAVTDYYCPRCAAPQLFEKLNSEDYYTGSSYVCPFCMGKFGILEWAKPDKAEQEAALSLSNKLCKE